MPLPSFSSSVHWAPSGKSHCRLRYLPPVLDSPCCRIHGRRIPAESRRLRWFASAAPSCGPASSYQPSDCRIPVPNPRSLRSHFPPTTTDSQIPLPPLPCPEHRLRHDLHTSSESSLHSSVGGHQ